MGEFRMPSLGADMDAGTLVEWRVAPGARVKRGDVVALVETQKGIVEVEIWEGGVIGELVVQPGTKVPVGTVLATLRGDEAPDVSRPAAPAHPEIPPPRAPSAAARVATNGPSGAAGVALIHESSVGRTTFRASPAARQLARELGIDLASVRGSGPHDAVTREDVLRVRSGSPSAPSAVSGEAPIAPPRSAPSPSAVSSVAGMRNAIAAAMSRSKREIPHYYLSLDMDVSRAAKWLEEENGRRPVTDRVLLAALLLKAVALALRETPELNGFYVAGELRPSTAVHVGVAISLRGGGLVAPAMHDTDRKAVGEVMSGLRDLVARARAGTLRSSEMSDPTVTVTNLGEQGSDAVFGVIYPPQVALVGFGTMRERPWAENGMLGVKPIVTATLSADHRASDGHRGARFLSTVARLLTEPEKL